PCALAASLCLPPPPPPPPPPRRPPPPPPNSRGPFWSACEEHGMVVNLHTGASGSATDTKFLYDAEHGGMLGLYEVFVFTRRPLWFMIFGGVFDRHPDLRV